MQDQRPPRLIMRFFRWFCHSELRRYVEGDLEELYQERLMTYGKGKANRKFFWDVLLLFRPGIIGFTKGNYSINNYGMFKNYLKVGARNLWKDRFYTSINLIGLSIGLSFSFLVLLLVKYEFSFENFYEDGARTFRVGVTYDIGGKVDSYGNAPRPLGPAMLEEFPEVVQYTRARGVNGLDEHYANLKYDQQYFRTDNIFVVDSTFIEVFDVEFVHGSRLQALNRPNAVVLSESLAARIFGESDPLGQEIEISENGRKLEVTGVFKDIPSNTHLPYEALVAWHSYYDPSINTSWYGRHVYTYVRLQRSDQANSVVDRFPLIFDKYMSERFNRMNGRVSLIVQPIDQIHLKSNLTWEPNQNGDLASVYVLLAIGVFLVVIAQVNYLNLSLARSSLRKKEISVRKVVGASKTNISSQFIVETLLFTFLALLISLFIIKLLYGEFISVSGVDVGPFQPTHLLAFVLISMSLGLLVSLYPALILSGMRLVDGLKSRSRSSRESGRLQKILVILQFTISTIVILFTFVVKNQLTYVANKDLGFDQQNVIVFPLEDSVLSNRSQLIKERVKAISGVIDASFALNRPGMDLNHTIVSVEDNGEYNSVGSQFMIVDHDFQKTIGMEIIEGRPFIIGSAKDADESIMINEAAKEKFGWQDGALGKKLYTSTDENGNPFYVNTIAVVKDFNVGSLHTKIEPIVIIYNHERGNQLLVKSNSQNRANVVEEISRLLNAYNPKIPVKHQFLEQELDRLYADERRLSKSMTYLSALTIVISVMGFIGLLSFSISQREKEIGIRKVLGADISGVMIMFYKEIFILILIAQIFAVPVNYYLSDQWLSSFEYRSFLNPYQIGTALLAIIVLSLLTLGFQIVKVAYMNPVDVIKDE